MKNKYNNFDCQLIYTVVIAKNRDTIPEMVSVKSFRELEEASEYVKSLHRDDDKLYEIVMNELW